MHFDLLRLRRHQAGMGPFTKDHLFKRSSVPAFPQSRSLATAIGGKSGKFTGVTER